MAKKTKASKKVTITFDEGQLPIIVRALEAFTRLRSGQITMALDEIYADKQTKMLMNHASGYNNDDDKDIENLIRKVYFKDLKHSNESFGVGGLGFGGDEAYTISKTLRQYLAYERNDGYAGFGVDFDGVIGKYGEYEKPKIHDFDTRKFFTAPKRLQAKLSELYDAERYEECFDLIDKKWKSLPDGNQYQISYVKEYDKNDNPFLSIGVWVTAPRKK